MGKNVDVLVSRFGPPASTFRMNSGEVAYAWQLSALTRITETAAKTNYCKVNVITSSTGIVTQLTTEDAAPSGNSIVEVAAGLAGKDLQLDGSICARYLGMRRAQ